MNNSESKSSKKKHKIVKEITKDVSIYNHDKISKAKLYSIDNLISMAGVFDEKHIEIFQDIAYKHILSDGDPWERVKKIHMGWRRKALELRDEELKSKNKSHKNIV
jgi:hypothetical protein